MLKNTATARFVFTSKGDRFANFTSILSRVRNKFGTLESSPITGRTVQAKVVSNISIEYLRISELFNRS